MIIKLILAASTALIITASAASAAEVAALTGDNTIAIVDTSQKKVVKTWNITGIAGMVLGIDVRPADGMLYALGADGGVYTGDTKTGKATQKSKLETMLPAGVKATVDFNPAADRLRVMGNDGTSLRVNVDDGTVTKDGSHKFADADMHKGELRACRVANGRHDWRAAPSGAAERRRAQRNRQARLQGRQLRLRHLVGWPGQE